MNDVKLTLMADWRIEMTENLISVIRGSVLLGPFFSRYFQLHHRHIEIK